MIGKTTFQEIFGEDEDSYELCSLIRDEDCEGVTNVKEELSYKSGWYVYSTVTFDYEGNRYAFEYKEHSSDNVSDMEYLLDTLVCFGEVAEIEQYIQREELSKIQIQYQSQLDKMNVYKEALDIIRPLSIKQLETYAKIFTELNPEQPQSSESKLGRFFKELSEMKQQKKW